MSFKMQSTSRSCSLDVIRRTSCCVPPRTSGISRSRSRSAHKSPFITNLSLRLGETASSTETSSALGPFRKSLLPLEKDSVICRYNNPSTHCFKTKFIPSPDPKPEYHFVIELPPSPRIRSKELVSHRGECHFDTVCAGDTLHHSTFQESGGRDFLPSNSTVPKVRPQQLNSTFYKLQSFYEKIESGEAKRHIGSLPNLSVTNSAVDPSTNQGETQLQSFNKSSSTFHQALPPHLRRRVDKSEALNSKSLQFLQALTQGHKDLDFKGEAGDSIPCRRLTKPENPGSENSLDLEVIRSEAPKFRHPTEIQPQFDLQEADSCGEIDTKVIWSKVKGQRDWSSMNSMDTSQPSRYLTDLEWRVCHAVNIYVYRNGVENHSPMLVHIPPSKKANMKLVLQVLNDRVKYAIGYAKSLYKMDGTKIQHPCELEMYNNYVIASNHDKHFKCVQYGRKRSPLLVLNTVSSKHARAIADKNERSALIKKASSSVDNFGCLRPCPSLERNISASTPTFQRKCNDHGRGVPMSMSHFGRPPLNAWNHSNVTYPRSPVKDSGEDMQAYLNIAPSRGFSRNDLKQNHDEGIHVFNVSMDPPETAGKRTITPQFLDLTNDTLSHHNVKCNVDDDVANDNFIDELLLRNSEHKFIDSFHNYETPRSKYEFLSTNNVDPVGDYSESSEFDDEDTDSYPNSESGRREEHPEDKRNFWTNRMTSEAETVQEELTTKIENGKIGSVMEFQEAIQPMTTTATYLCPRGGKYTVRHHLKDSTDQTPPFSSTDSINLHLDKLSFSTLESTHSTSNATGSFSSFASEGEGRHYRDLKPLPSPLPLFFGHHPREHTLSQLPERRGSFTGKYDSVPEPHERLLPTLNHGFLLGKNSYSYDKEYGNSKTEFPFVTVPTYPTFTPLEFPRELLRSQGFSFVPPETETDFLHNQFQLKSSPTVASSSRRRQRHIQEYKHTVDPSPWPRNTKDMAVQTSPSDFLYRSSLHKLQPRPSSIAYSTHRLETNGPPQRREFQTQVSEQMLPGYDHRRIKRVDRMTGTIPPPLQFENVDMQRERQRSYSILVLPPPTPFADRGISLCRRSSSSVEPGISQTIFRTLPTTTLSAVRRPSKPPPSPQPKNMTYHVEDFIFKKGKKYPLQPTPTKNMTPRKPSHFKVRTRR